MSLKHTLTTVWWSCVVVERLGSNGLSHVPFFAGDEKNVVYVIVVVLENCGFL